MDDNLDVEQALRPYITVASQTFGKDITTGRTMRLAEYVGSPHERLKVVHIAGTSGKTSTSYYIRALLEAAGQTTGLTVSPHITNIAERVQLHGSPLNSKKFVQYLQEFLQFIKTVPETPTYFELLLVFALWVFDRENVNYAVLETGLGGLHDSTNICRRNDKICVLTDIGYDHMQILGNSLAEITAQKSGIIATDNVVVMHKQADEIMCVVEKETSKQRARSILAKNNELTVDNMDMAEYQKRNWSLAYAVYQQVKKRDGLPELSLELLQETMQIQVPGRMEIFEIKGKKVILDGAHNEQKMRVFVASFEHKFSDKKPLILLGMKQEKDIDKVVAILASITERVVATEPSIIQDLPLGTLPSGSIAESVRRHGIECHEESNAKRALNWALSQPNDMIIITGSLYLVAEIRALISSNVV